MLGLLPVSNASSVYDPPAPPTVSSQFENAATPLAAFIDGVGDMPEHPRAPDGFPGTVDVGAFSRVMLIEEFEIMSPLLSSTTTVGLEANVAVLLEG